MKMLAQLNWQTAIDLDLLKVNLFEGKHSGYLSVPMTTIDLDFLKANLFEGKHLAIRSGLSLAFELQGLPMVSY